MHYSMDDLTEQSEGAETPIEPPTPPAAPVHLVSDTDVCSFVNQERTTSLLRQRHPTSGAQ